MTVQNTRLIWIAPLAIALATSLALAQEPSFKDALNHWLPGMAAEDLKARRDAQQQFQDICLRIAAPGKQAERISASKLMAGHLRAATGSHKWCHDFRHESLLTPPREPFVSPNCVAWASTSAREAGVPKRFWLSHALVQGRTINVLLLGGPRAAAGVKWDIPVEYHGAESRWEVT